MTLTAKETNSPIIGSGVLPLHASAKTNTNAHANTTDYSEILSVD